MTNRLYIICALAAMLALHPAPTCRAQTGACCAPDGTCTSQAASSTCAFPNYFLPDGVCAPNSCPPTGTCCTIYGGCVVDFQVYCSGTNTWTGGRTCGPPNPCPIATGSCCSPVTGACSVLTPAACASPNTWTNGGTCNPNLCPGSGSCCSPVTGSCSVTLAGGCAAPRIFTAGAGVCSPNPCAPGAPVVNPANGHTYRMTPTATTWPAAEAYAQSLGGHLVTIRSSAEQSWIRSVFLAPPDNTRALWIGFHRTVAHGPFAWSSGEPVVFTFWHSGQPDDGCGGEPATAMNWFASEGMSGDPGDWNDSDDGGVHFSDCASEGHVPYYGIVEIDLIPGACCLSTGPCQSVTSTACAASNGVFQGANTTCAVARCEPCPAQRAIFDLTQDWSDTHNPNGVWSCNEGVHPLPHVSAWDSAIFDWTSPQPAWAYSNTGSNRAPAWFKVSAGTVSTYDWALGDVALHTLDPAAGQGNADGNVTWTCPRAGVINISGGCWRVRENGRSTIWRLYHNGVFLSQGKLFDGDPYSREFPFRFDTWSSGPSVVHNVQVALGDTIKLEVVRNPPSPYGDLVAVQLRVEFPSRCPADFNCSGSVTVQDIFDFLLAWFAGDARADLNGVDGVTVQDIFDFLAAWFAGC